MGRRNDEEHRKSPIDFEYLAYVKQKKEIKDKIQDHFKTELTSNNNLKSNHKGKSMNKINDDVFSQDQQWLTIVNYPSIINNKTDDPVQKETEKNEVSLIDTFTANLDNPSDKLDSYRVNGEVGTLIAQKMFKGEKFIVGRNGVAVNSDNQDSSGHNHGKRDSLGKLFEELEVPPGCSALCWKEQVEKSNVKIIQPKLPQIILEKKPKPERNLIVKKLNEEEEYKPKVKKIPFELIPLNQQKLITKHQIERVPNSSMNNSKVSVEVVGSNNLITNPFQQNNSNSSRSEFNKNDFSFESTTINPQFTIPATRPPVVLSLSEKNYLQIIDNLTSRYGSAGAEKKSNESSNIKKVIQIHQNSNKETTRDLFSLEFINDLGINTDRLASNHPHHHYHHIYHQQQYPISYSENKLLKKKKLKLLKKKFNLNDFNHNVNDNNNINNNNNKKETLNNFLPQVYSSLSASSSLMQFNNSGNYINKELNTKYDAILNRKISRIDKIPNNLNNLHSQSYNLLTSFQNNENSQTKLQSLGGGYFYSTTTNLPINIKSLPGIKGNTIEYNNNRLRQNRNLIAKDTKFVQMVKPLSPLFRDSPGSTYKKLDNFNGFYRDDYNGYSILTPSTSTQSIARFNQEI